MTSARESGIEIVLEPDVRPRGTVDLRALDAPPGSVPPAVRVTSTGRVVSREAPSGFSPPISALVTAPPVPASVTLPPPAPRASEGTISAEQLIEAAEAAATDTRTLAALDEAASAPIPPRPAAASAASPSAVPELARRHEPDLDPDALGQGFSAIWTLLKVLLYLLTLTALLGALGWWLVGDSWREPTVASIEPAELTPPPSESPPVEAPPVEAPPVEPVTPPPPSGPGPLAPSGEELAFEALKIVAEEASTGGEVGVEEDSPGLLAKIEALRAQAVEALKKRDLAGARAALLELLAQNPRDADATFRLGLVEERDGKSAEAEVRYRAATELAPDDPRPHNNLGLLLLARQAPDEARASFERGLAARPDDPNLNVNLGRLEEKAAADQALQRYDRALAADPAHGPARLARARLRRTKGQADGAKEDLTALAQSGSPLAAPALDGLGLLAREGGRLEESVTLHRRALEVDAGWAPARINLGLALLEQGKTADAATELQRAVKAAPQDARAWAALGVARTRLGEKEPEQLYDAKDAYERALKLDPRDASTLFNYAMCAERFGNFLFAMRKYEELLQLDPKAWKGYANLARLYQRGNDPQKARALLERGLGEVPDAADLHYQLAWLLAAERREAEARSALQRFVELARPDDPRLGEAKRGLGDRGS